MSCPLMDSDRSDCSVNLNIQHLDEAFERCLDRYELCPIFIRWSNNRLATVGRQAVPGEKAGMRLVKIK